MILIDTSSWIHLLRPNGDPAVRSRVEAALRAGEACWCPIVQLELWNGARGDREKRALRDFAAILPVLPIGEDVWRAAYEGSPVALAPGASPFRRPMWRSQPARKFTAPTSSQPTATSSGFDASPIDMLATQWNQQS